MKTTIAILSIIALSSGCASDNVADYLKSNPADERGGEVFVWKGLGVEFTAWKYHFKGKAEEPAK